MRLIVHCVAWLALASSFSPQLCLAAETAPLLAAAQELIDQGEFREAEKLLRPAIDPSAPATTEAAVMLEILGRTRADFPHDEAEIVKQLKESIPDVKESEVEAWRDAGVLQSKKIDGEHRYFRNSAANLFRLSEEARKRRAETPPAPKRYDLDKLIVKLNKLAQTADTPAIYPVRHKVRYKLSIHEGHPRLKPGATVRAWLPYPQEYRIQQTDVKHVSSTGGDRAEVAPNGTPQRTIYFEQKVDEKGTAPSFEAEYQFTAHAYVPTLKPEMVKSYDEESDVYINYTAERLPHIAFTRDAKKLVEEIIGDEENPLQKARLIFRWVSKNLPWVSEMEYSTISSLSKKGIAARCGDCGVQNTTFITLCRIAGIPARWQSGFGTKPDEEGMHDWAEIYIEPWGWLPADASYGVRKSDDPEVRDFFCGHMDPYRFIVNLDYGRQLHPPKISFRSEPIDFQRGEVEIDGHNLYFDEWDWELDVDSTPLKNEK